MLIWEWEKKKSLIIRLFTDLFTPIAAISAHFAMRCDTESNPIYCKLNIYGHCLLIGLFTYVLLADLLPVLLESNNADDHQDGINTNTNDLEQNKGTEISDEIRENQKKSWRHLQTIYVIFCFILSFAAVTAVILISEESHSH